MLPADREARVGSAAIVPAEAGAVGRGDGHAAQGMRREGPHRAVGAELREEAPRLGGDALSADLVPREASLVEEQDVVPALLQHHRHGGSGGAAPDDDDVARAGAGHHTHAAFCATASSPYGKTRRMRTGIPASAKAVASSSAVKARRIERAPSATLTRDRRSKGKSDRANT